MLVNTDGKVNFNNIIMQHAKVISTWIDVDRPSYTYITSIQM